jgi:hypothetical protein
MTDKYGGWEKNMGRRRQGCNIMYKEASVEISKDITLN